MLTAATLAHVLVTVAFALALRLVGEASVLTTLGLYLPRWPLGMPLPVLVFALAWRRRYRLLALELLAGWCWVFPLLGLRLGVARSPTPGRHVLRVLSFNVNEQTRSPALLRALRRANADLIVLQECGDESAAFWKSHLGEYQWSQRDQFALGSRFPIAETSPAFQQGAAYVRYRVELPEGPLYVYSVHPPSPRLSVSGLFAEPIKDEPRALARVSADIDANTTDREHQLRVIIDDARSSHLPLIIAGDTNLPDLSPVLARTCVGFEDAFGEVGRGFGYTFPADGRGLGPWLRLDRVFVSHALRVLDFATLPEASSDHLPVLAVVER